MNSLKIVLFITVVFLCFLGVFKVKKKLIQGLSLAILLICLGITITMVLNTNKSVKYANSTYRMKEKAETLRLLYVEHGTYEKIPSGQLAELEIDYFNDDWGKTIEKDFNETAFQFKSLGRDGAAGGKSFDQDIIISWKLGDEQISVSAWNMK